MISINSQSKLKKLSILFLRYLPRKTRYEIFHGGFFELQIPESFTRAFLLKTIIFFSSTVEWSPLKRNKKSSQKRCKSPKNCLTVDIARDRRKTLKREKK